MIHSRRTSLPKLGCLLFKWPGNLIQPPLFLTRFLYPPLRGSNIMARSQSVLGKLGTSPNHNQGNKKPAPEFPQGRESIANRDRDNLTSAKSLAAFIGWNLNFSSLLIVAHPCQGTNANKLDYL